MNAGRLGLGTVGSQGPGGHSGGRWRQATRSRAIQRRQWAPCLGHQGVGQEMALKWVFCWMMSGFPGRTGTPLLEFHACCPWDWKPRVELEKEDQLGTGAGPSKMGTEHVLLNTYSSRGHRWHQRAPCLWHLLLTKPWVEHGLMRTASEQTVLCDKEKERPLPLPRARGASLPSFCNYL